MRRTLRIVDVVYGTPRAGKREDGVLPFVLFAAASEKARLPSPRSQPMSAGRQVHPVIQRSEPMFNVPPVVLATVAVLVLVHALRMLVLTEAEDVRFLLTFAFIPARYDVDLVAGGSFPGGCGPGQIAAAASPDRTH
jgi:hypothetical protein